VDPDLFQQPPTGIDAGGSHYYGFIEAKLLWDTLETGTVDRSIPRGGALSAEYLPELIDRHGPQRLCSGNSLADTDRAALTRAPTTGRRAEVVAKVTRSLDRLDEACRAARAGSRPRACADPRRRRAPRVSVQCPAGRATRNRGLTSNCRRSTIRLINTSTSAVTRRGRGATASGRP